MGNLHSRDFRPEYPGLRKRKSQVAMESLLKRPFKREGVRLPRVNVCGELCSSGAGQEALLRVLLWFSPVKWNLRTQSVGVGFVSRPMDL